MKNWTGDQVKILIENYNKLPNRELYKLFPNKTPKGIYKKAYKLGLRKAPQIEYMNRSLSRKGEICPAWKGGIAHTTRGYKLIKMPGYPRADSHGYVLEHIYVFEKESGVAVPENCCIHHINGNKEDNRIENLCLMTFVAHTKHHHVGTKRSVETRERISLAMRRAKC